MELTYFYPHIPPAWLVQKLTKDTAGKTFRSTQDKFIFEPEQNNTYIYFSLNSQGYRETEYAKNYFEFDRLVLAFGHSSVFGYSVRNEQCWPRMLEQCLPNSRVLNFGIAQSSMDTTARMISCVVPFFKPLCRKLEVAALWAQPDRREIFQENYKSVWSPWQDPPFPEYILTIDDVSNRYNHEKNETMIRALCAQHDVPLHVVPWEIYENAIANDQHPTAMHHKEMMLSILKQIV
jgi:hypothetical protein